MKIGLIAERVNQQEGLPRRGDIAWPRECRDKPPLRIAFHWDTDVRLRRVQSQLECKRGLEPVRIRTFGVVALEPRLDLQVNTTGDINLDAFQSADPQKRADLRPYWELLFPDLVVPASLSQREMLRLRDRLYRIYADATGQTVDKIAKDCDRNKWLDDHEMLEYGLVDAVLKKMPTMPRRHGESE